MKLFENYIYICLQTCCVQVHVETLQKSSAAEACRDAKGLLADNSNCSLAALLASWSGDAGHEERSFERFGFSNISTAHVLKCPSTSVPLKKFGFLFKRYGLHVLESALVFGSLQVV